MTIIPLVAGAAVGLFGLLMLVMPRMSREWRHPLGQPLPLWVIRLLGLLLAVAGFGLMMIFLRV
jgi:type VI protein secretion system component VasF